MAEDWLVDVRKYASDANESVVAAIVSYCGIALNSRDSALVAFSDRKETDLVRENFLRKKLALTDDDAVLDAAIADVGQRMKADRTKNRVTVYYLLAEHFGLLGLFGAAAPVAGASAAALMERAAPAAVVAAAAAGAAAPVALRASAPATPQRDDVPILTLGGATFAAMLGAALIGMVIAGQMAPRDPDAPAALPSPNPADFPVQAPAAAPASAPAPSGAGVIAGERDGKPMLTTYFDTGKAVVAPDFQTQAAAVLSYLKDHPAATTAISGFNDPSGNAALNAELSKNRAKAVQAALVASGVDQARTDLVKPADSTSTTMTAAEARRVEVTIVGQ